MVILTVILTQRALWENLFRAGQDDGLGLAYTHKARKISQEHCDTIKWNKCFLPVITIFPVLVLSEFKVTSLITGY